MADTPLVVRFDSFPLDVTEHVKLFERSRFNYFRRDDESGTIMGFWDVENGEEWTDIGVREWGLAPKDEIIVVLEGEIYVHSDGGLTEAAGPGDAIVILRGRRTHLQVPNRAKAFFIVYGTDPGRIERLMRGHSRLA